MNGALALLAAILVAKAPQVRVAVMDAKAQSPQDAEVAKVLGQVVASEVGSAGKLAVIDSAGIAQVLGLERQKQLLGCSDSGCMTELAGALGVDYLVSTQLGRLGSRFRLDLRLVDARRGITQGAWGRFVDSVEGLGPAAQEGVHVILREAHLITEAPPSAVATAPPPKVEPSPSRVPAYVTLGAAAALAIAAGAATYKTSADYAELQRQSQSASESDFAAQQSKVRWDGRIADGLWLLTAVGVGAGVYLFLSPPGGAAPGSGGEVGVGGRF